MQNFLDLVAIARKLQPTNIGGLCDDKLAEAVQALQKARMKFRPFFHLTLLRRKSKLLWAQLDDSLDQDSMEEMVRMCITLGTLDDARSFDFMMPLGSNA